MSNSSHGDFIPVSTRWLFKRTIFHLHAVGSFYFALTLCLDDRILEALGDYDYDSVVLI